MQTTLRSQAIEISVVIVLLCLLFLSVRGCIADSNNPPEHETHIHTTERHLVLRPDSTTVTVTTPPVTYAIRTTLKRGISTHDSDHIERLDSTGFFSVADTTKHDPDTVSIFHNLLTNEFALMLRTSRRDQEQQVKYLAHDSLRIEHDSVTIRTAIPRSWWEDAAMIFGETAVGTLIGIILTLVALR